MTTTIALFGSTGNVGNDLVKALSAKAGRHHNFLVFSRTDDPNKKIEMTEHFKVQVLPKKADGTDTDALSEMLSSANVETIFLCIPQMLVVESRSYVEDLIPAWKKSGIVRVVKVGTGNAKAYEYGRKHAEAEQAIRYAGLKLTVLEGGDFSTNPPWLGPSPPGISYALIDIFKGLSYLSYLGLPFFRSMGNVACFYNEDTIEPFLDLRDYGEALAVVLLNATDHEGKTYHIYSDAVTPRDIANIYGELLGRKLYVVKMSDDEIKTFLAMKGIKGEFADLLIDMFKRFKEGVFEPDESWNGFAEITGKRPRTFKDFAKEKVGSGWKPLKFGYLLR